jgi:hypothetical protein
VKIVVTSVSHVVKSFFLVLILTGITPKELWIHSCVWNISCEEIKESPRLPGRLRRILRLRVRAKPTKVGGAASSLEDNDQSINHEKLELNGTDALSNSILKNGEKVYGRSLYLPIEYDIEIPLIILIFRWIFSNDDPLPPISTSICI